MKTTRRSFLARALAAIGVAGVAPLLARTTVKSKPLTVDDYKTIHTGPPPGRLVRVEGLAIKVPSNRVPYWTGSVYDADQSRNGWAYEYIGDWDGTFALERGCTNPAFILADLYERTGEEPDWVVQQRFISRGPLSSVDVTSLFEPHLNWQMLYAYGCWCDEQAIDRVWLTDGGLTTHYFTAMSEGPRFTTNAMCQTREDMDRLRETLRMHCLSWQSQDPRYRTSWPGVRYPECTPLFPITLHHSGVTPRNDQEAF